MRFMRTTRAVGLCALLASCGSPAQQGSEVTILAAAIPCYTAVAAAASGTGFAGVLTGASVLALSPACTGLDTATLQLIASAVNTGAAVTAGPANLTALGRRARG
jgi:hypothetical protein